MKRNNVSYWMKKNSKYIFSNNKLTQTIFATHLNNVWLLSYLGKKSCILIIWNWHLHLTLTNLATVTLQHNCMECNQSHLEIGNLLSLNLVHGQILPVSNPVSAELKYFLNVRRPMKHSAVQFQVFVWHKNVKYISKMQSLKGKAQNSGFGKL